MDIFKWLMIAVSTQILFANSSVCTLITQDSRCTCFAISETEIVTNHHCVPTQKSADFPVRVNFNDFDVEPDWISCDKLVYTSVFFDYTILKCNKRLPVSGVATYDGKLNTDNAYISDYNCDVERDRFCIPKKRNSYCKVLKREGIFNQNYIISYESSRGSSGSPVFVSDTKHSGKLICVHSLNSSRNDAKLCININYDKFPYTLITKPYDLVMKKYYELKEK